MWDCTNNRAMIYIDPCIKRVNVLAKIKAAFDLTDYVLAEDDHYCCQRSADSLFVDGIRNITVLVRKADCENAVCFFVYRKWCARCCKIRSNGGTKEDRSVMGYA